MPCIWFPKFYLLNFEILFIALVGMTSICQGKRILAIFEVLWAYLTEFLCFSWNFSIARSYRVIVVDINILTINGLDGLLTRLKVVILDLFYTFQAVCFSTSHYPRLLIFYKNSKMHVLLRATMDYHTSVNLELKINTMQTRFVEKPQEICALFQL